MSDEIREQIREQVLAALRNQGHGMTVVQIYSVCPAANSELEILAALRGLVAENKVIKDGIDTGGAIYYRLPGQSSKPLPTKPKHTPAPSETEAATDDAQKGRPKKASKTKTRGEQAIGVIKKHGEVTVDLVADELSITKHAAYQVLIALSNKKKITRCEESRPHTYSLTIGSPAQTPPAPDRAPNSEMHHSGFDFALWNSGDFTITKDGDEIVRLEPDTLAGMLDYIGLVKPVLRDMFLETTQ